MKTGTADLADGKSGECKASNYFEPKKWSLLYFFCKQKPCTGKKCGKRFENAEFVVNPRMRNSLGQFKVQ